MHSCVCAIPETPKTGFRNILGSTFQARTYQAALREGLFRKPCRRSWALIPLPECHGVLTDQKFPRRLRWWRRFNDRKVEKGKGTRKRKKKQNLHAYDKVTARERAVKEKQWTRKASVGNDVFCCISTHLSLWNNEQDFCLHFLITRWNNYLNTIWILFLMNTNKAYRSISKNSSGTSKKMVSKPKRKNTLIYLYLLTLNYIWNVDICVPQCCSIQETY